MSVYSSYSPTAGMPSIGGGYQGGVGAGFGGATQYYGGSGTGGAAGLYAFNPSLGPVAGVPPPTLG